MKDRTVCRYLFCSQATRCLLCHYGSPFTLADKGSQGIFPAISCHPTFLPSFSYICLRVATTETIENRARKRLANFFPTSEDDIRALAAVGLASTFPISLLNPRDPHPVGQMEKFSRHQTEGRMKQSERRQTPQLKMYTLGLNILKKWVLGWYLYLIETCWMATKHVSSQHSTFIDERSLSLLETCHRNSLL